MQRIKGLKEFTQNKEYRKAMELPSDMLEEYEFLAQGEYNINYVFTHPVWNKKLILRVNTKSQMNLENQIEYEYNALKLLEESKRVPKVYYVDGKKDIFLYGVLVMEYIEGHSMDYKKEIFEGAKILADIHSVNINNETHLINPANPLKAILLECKDLIKVYNEFHLSDNRVKKTIAKLMDKAFLIANNSKEVSPYTCCINTELNSTNFLINNHHSMLIDWEKPIKGDPAQDLGHFLAPTTTFWKTDVLLNEKEVDEFIKEYKKAVGNRFNLDGIEKRTKQFIAINCIRGITWCAMAWCEYQSEEKLIKNESTLKKLNAYLDISFLESIEKYLV